MAIDLSYIQLEKFHLRNPGTQEGAEEGEDEKNA